MTAKRSERKPTTKAEEFDEAKVGLVKLNGLSRKQQAAAAWLSTVRITMIVTVYECVVAGLLAGSVAVAIVVTRVVVVEADTAADCRSHVISDQTRSCEHQAGAQDGEH
ncbi:MAG TPA: hypothetical protein VGO73_09535 [Pyrinomonadaceae bacterium]|jgi:hypothetical protein|nr:hypothetical protein [Pyrinomonadaceae bacterium]